MAIIYLTQQYRYSGSVRPVRRTKSSTRVYKPPTGNKIALWYEDLGKAESRGA